MDVARVLALQQTAGNAAVGRLLARKPKPKPQSFVQDAAGAIHLLDDAGTTQPVGTASQIAVDDKGERAVAVTAAVIGHVRPAPDGADAAVARVRAATVHEAAEPGSPPTGMK